MRVLIVEDNTRISALLTRALEEEGYAIVSAADGDDGYRLASEQQFDAAIVDVMLPGRSGTDLVRALRADGNSLPVLLLTARDRSEDKVAGLDAGADDYLTKPFDFAELAARMRALLRRNAPGAPAKLRVGGIELDTTTHEVHVDGMPVDTTPREFALLEYLMRNTGRVLTRADIMVHVWDIRFNTRTNVVDVFVNALRNKVDPERTLIRTVRGIGYVLDAPEGR